MTRLRAHPFHRNTVPQKRPVIPANGDGALSPGTSLPTLALSVKSLPAVRSVWIAEFVNPCACCDEAVKSHRVHLALFTFCMSSNQYPHDLREFVHSQQLFIGLHCSH